MDPLDLPRTIPAAAAEARRLGIPISDWKLWRMARAGQLAVSPAGVGQRMTTVRAIIAALSPRPLAGGLPTVADQVIELTAGGRGGR